MAPSLLPPPAINWGLTVSALKAGGYDVVKARPGPPAASTNRGGASTAEELRQFFHGPRPQYSRGPDAPQIQLKWCPKPPGSPGRSEYNIKDLLRMTRLGYSYFRGEIRKILQHDPEIDMNKSITKETDFPDIITRLCYEISEHFTEFESFRSDKFWPIEAVIHGTLRNSSGKFNALRQQLKIEAAQAKGEVVQPKVKKPRVQTTARGKANRDKVRSRATTNHSDTPTTGRTPTVLPTPETPPAMTDSEDNSNDNNGDINMHKKVFDTEDALGDLTHGMSIIAIDPAQDDEPDEVVGSILADLPPDATSTPFPARITTHAPRQPPTLPLTAPTPTGNHMEPPTPILDGLSRRRELTSEPIATGSSVSTAFSTAVATTKVPGVVAVLPPVMAAPVPPPALFPPQLLTQEAIGTHILTPEVIAQIAQIASLVPEAQRALLPAAVWQLFMPANSFSSDPVPASTSTLNPTASVLAGIAQHTPGPFSDDNEPPSGALSASESNPPLVNEQTDAADSASRPWKTTATASKLKKAPLGDNNGPGLAAAASGAGAAKAIQDAKVIAEAGGDIDLTDAPNKMSRARKAKGKGKAVATAVDVDEEDQPVNTKRTTKRATRNSKK